MADPSAEMPAAERPRYSEVLEPDLEIEVEGEVFRMHSFVLMYQSPVFATMLKAGMRENQEGRIKLEGKKKVEFAEFLRQLQTLKVRKLPSIAPRPQVGCYSGRTSTRWPI